MTQQRFGTRELTRRSFLAASSAAVGLVALPGLATRVLADPQGTQAQWLKNFEETRLLDDAGAPIAWLPQWSLMQLFRPEANGMLQVWVPRLRLVGRVQASSVGPVAAPSPDQLSADEAAYPGPPLIELVGLPGRISGGAYLRLWPVVRSDTLLRNLAHNAPVRVLATVEGEDGQPWHNVQWLNPATYEPAATGYVSASLVRLPRLHYEVNGGADRLDVPDRHFEADLRDPVLLTAFENGGPIWCSMALKGTIAHQTPPGWHSIVRRVANETMSSERVYPPVPIHAPGGYYLKNVLWTQYFTADGASIHYNYWSSNWGYPGSHGCLGLPYDEAKWAWSWADIGTPVLIFS